MNRDDKIAHVMQCICGKAGLTSIRSDHVAQLVSSCAKAVDSHWPEPKPTTPPGAE